MLADLEEDLMIKINESGFHVFVTAVVVGLI